MTPAELPEPTHDLTKASDALAYEISMLCEIAALYLASAVWPLRARTRLRMVINNALVQSLATHARNLILFFYDECPGSDDMVAPHFVVDVIAWLDKRPSESPLFAAARKRANKEVAHPPTQGCASIPPRRRGISPGWLPSCERSWRCSAATSNGTR